jgi:hypothetical protein
MAISKNYQSNQDKTIINTIYRLKGFKRVSTTISKIGKSSKLGDI